MRRPTGAIHDSETLQRRGQYDSRWRSRLLASNRSRGRSSETSFTPRPILPEVLHGVHSATGLGVVERAIERRVQSVSIFGAELIVRHRQYV
jgi:hypothetical protein